MMPGVELSVQGPKTGQRLRYVVHGSDPVRIGRSTMKGWDIPWDLAISREHADICVRNGRLVINTLPSALNEIIYDGQILRDVEIPIGESFQIGGTLFQVRGAEDSVAAADVRTVAVAEPGNVVARQMFTLDDLEQSEFGNAENQLEILARLPQVISQYEDDEKLASVLAGMLLEAVPHAVAVAVCEYDIDAIPPDNTTSEFPIAKMACVDTRDSFKGRFRPSRRLIAEALLNQQSALQIWDLADEDLKFTRSEGLEWAFVAPVRNESSRGWCLYVSGQGKRDGGHFVVEEDLKGDLRFTELVAQFIGSIRQVRRLQQQKTQLSSFFSPNVIKSMTADKSFKNLEPSVREITVLFCDLRDFSRQSEENRDELLRLLQTVRTALGRVAGGILEYDGAIADFQGDAVLGFWGWPVQLEEGPIPACRAALEIFERFAAEAPKIRRKKQLGIGMGIAFGRAVAGEIGTEMQAKVGAFGPVVNQGARLEGMTKQFGVPICVDEACAEFIRKYLPRDEGGLRRLARVYPTGMKTPVTVYALVPASQKSMSDELIGLHDAAVTCVIEGRWREAVTILEELPRGDGPSDFLWRYLTEHREPPPNWDGAITLRYK